MITFLPQLAAQGQKLARSEEEAERLAEELRTLRASHLTVVATHRQEVETAERRHRDQLRHELDEKVPAAWLVVGVSRIESRAQCMYVPRHGHIGQRWKQPT